MNVGTIVWLKPSTFWSTIRFSGVRKHSNRTLVTTDCTIASSVGTLKKKDIDEKMLISSLL